MNCICQDQSQASINNCVICLQDKLIPLTAWEREERCEIHQIERDSFTLLKQCKREEVKKYALIVK